MHSCKSALGNKRLCATVSTVALLLSCSAYAAPTGGVVTAGNAGIAQSGSLTSISQGSDRAVIDWQGFDVGAGERVEFHQPSASAITLNRIHDAKPSQILGSITANGQVALINPNGILFGKGSRVDVSGLIASTADTTNDAFMAGGPLKLTIPGKADASIRNEGTITVRDTGLIAMVAPHVANDGILTARMGTVALAGAETATIDLYGDGLLSLAVSDKATATAVTNHGTITAGTILLTATQASSLLSSTINMDGVAQASGIEISGDVVTLTGTLDASGPLGGDISLAARNLALEGTLSANGTSGFGGTISLIATGSLIDNSRTSITANGTAGGHITLDAGKSGYLSGRYDATGSLTTGGSIHLTADTLNLYGTQVNASGRTGGGTILAGGDYQGKGTLRHASTTRVGPSTTLKADATRSGKGGKVVVWSDSKTEFKGKVQARGGPYGGNGGLLEVSSKDTLSFAGLGDAGAPAGAPGALLLDPKNITIANAGTTSLLDTTEIPDPTGGGATSGFGYSYSTALVSLPNGNIVITAINDDFAATNAGAVYLFDGSGALISTLRGSNANDQVGSYGVTALTNGNFVVSTPGWNSNQGAVTWVNGVTGLNGSVTVANSLVGTALTGNGFVTALPNGNYVVGSPNWNSNRGAVTRANGTTGLIGTIDATNSLVGSISGDYVGYASPTILNNGNYVVGTYSWDGDKGSATWGNASSGITGTINSSNSWLGTNSGDYVGGSDTIIPLTDGNFLIANIYWNNFSGAVTHVSGTASTGGTIDSTNSLVGASASDFVGVVAKALPGGKYVIGSPFWNSQTGAATWGDGVTPLTGFINASNSLIGTAAGDLTGNVFTLTNGNYVVTSAGWSSNRGAATLVNGATGQTGILDTSTSLVGSNPNDRVGGNGVMALSNGNYVVLSASWDGNKGAATWGNGVTGISGTVSSANSMIGNNPNDYIGSAGFALTNGNYVLTSNNWNGVRGAVTWGNGATGTTGVVDATNSLVGTNPNDSVGDSIRALTNGNYIVISSGWNNTKGALTWGDGTSGVSGAVTSSNSLVGSNANDFISTNVQVFSNGDYITYSDTWNGGQGAATLGDGSKGTIGTVDAGNSILGTAAGVYPSFSVTYNSVTGKTIIGDPSSGKVYSSTPVDATNVAYTVNRSTGNSLAPSFLTQILDTGTDVNLQASNDITINDPIVTNNGGGTGGNITLSAGRSLILNADLTSDGGNITLVGNDTLANGVVDAERDAGASSITMAAGTRIDAGSGTVSIQLLDGAGKTNSTGGDITLRDVIAGSLTVQNSNAGGNVTFESALEGMDLSVTTTAGDVTFNANPGAVTPLGDVTMTNVKNLTGDSLFANSFTLTGGTGNVTFSNNSVHAAGDISIDTAGDITGGYHGVNGHLFSTAGNLSGIVEFDTLDIDGLTALFSHGRVGSTAGPATQDMANLIMIRGQRWPAGIPSADYTYAGYRIGLVPAGGGGVPVLPITPPAGGGSTPPGGSLPPVTAPPGTSLPPLTADLPGSVDNPSTVGEQQDASTSTNISDNCIYYGTGIAKQNKSAGCVPIVILSGNAQ